MKDRVSTRILRLAPLVLALVLVGCAADQQELNPFFPGGNEAAEAGGKKRAKGEDPAGRRRAAPRVEPSTRGKTARD